MGAYRIFLKFFRSIYTYCFRLPLITHFQVENSFCLLLTSLFLICELCDIFKENGIVLMLGYFITGYLFIIHNKRKIQLEISLF